jgi:NTP pyrophosphatase (non-canonical NTP hydrolase)
MSKVRQFESKEEEILTILAEECAELIQEIMKLKRQDACKFPTASFVKEVGDVYVMLELARDVGLFTPKEIDARKVAKAQQLKVWSHIFDPIISE